MDDEQDKGPVSFFYEAVQTSAHPGCEAVVLLAIGQKPKEAPVWLETRAVWGGRDRVADRARSPDCGRAAVAGGGDRRGRAMSDERFERFTLDPEFYGDRDRIVVDLHDGPGPLC